MKEIRVVSWKLLPHEMSCENNHVYSIVLRRISGYGYITAPL